MDEKNSNYTPSYLKFSPAYNYINSNKIKLPTKLNPNDSSDWLKVSEDGLIVIYGGGKNNNFFF
jgi:hypothetical protein